MTDITPPADIQPTIPKQPVTGLGEMVWCDATNTLDHGDGFTETFACIRLEHGPESKHKASRREPGCPGCNGHDDHAATCGRPAMPAQVETDFEW